MKQATKIRHAPDYYSSGILRGDRVVLAQAITIIESTRPEDRQLAASILNAILPSTGKSIRIGISGPPGVGKSTFIEAFGQHIISTGKKIAVLTIDPSSQVTKGSILGDKTRMNDLATNPNAFIRPSASADALGGVAHKTRESILLCEAAGYDVVLIETVGVGQSEVAVKNMTDVFLLLMLAGSGDELQGIKKGIMEMADVMVITKADGDNLKRAKEARAEFQQAVHLLFSGNATWIPKVLTASAIQHEGIAETWQTILDFVDVLQKNGRFDETRQSQHVSHLHEHFNLMLRTELEQNKELEKIRLRLEEDVRTNRISPTDAGNTLFEAFRSYLKTNS